MQRMLPEERNTEVFIFLAMSDFLKIGKEILLQ
jgi:hypothetical protein